MFKPGELLSYEEDKAPTIEEFYNYDIPDEPEPEPESAVKPHYYQSLIADIPLMSREEIKERMASIAKNDSKQVTELRNEILVRNLRLAAYFARLTMGWKTYGSPVHQKTNKSSRSGIFIPDLSSLGQYPMPIDDRIQEGSMALIKAAEKYRPGIANFSTYSWYWLERLVVRSILSDASVRFPVHVWEALSQVETAKRPLGQKTFPSMWEAIGVQSDESPKMRLRHLRNLRQMESIEVLDEQEPIDSAVIDYEPDDEVPPIFSEKIQDPNQDIEEEFEVFARAVALDAALAALQGRQQDVIQSRYTQEQTLDEIAKRYRVTRERIRQIENDILRKLLHDARLYNAVLDIDSPKSMTLRSIRDKITDLEDSMRRSEEKYAQTNDPIFLRSIRSATLRKMILEHNYTFVLNQDTQHPSSGANLSVSLYIDDMLRRIKVEQFGVSKDEFYDLTYQKIIDDVKRMIKVPVDNNEKFEEWLKNVVGRNAEAAKQELIDLKQPPTSFLL